ncbi:alpha-amylase family protein [Porphyromonas sp.]
MQEKIIIYSVLTRLWGNKQTTRKPHGSLAENGAGKMRDFSPEALAYIRSLGATHVWYIGLLEHATKTDYSSYDIRPDHPDTVKGEAGSPYAVKDYYDIDPDLAEDPHERQREFDALIERTHQAGLRVLMDFIPNHVARTYHSDACPTGVEDLGATDDVQRAFSPSNNFYYLPDQALTLPLSTESSPYREYPARATGNDCFSPYPSINDWYETVKLNYGVDYCGGSGLHSDPIPDTWVKMRDILCYWAGRGVDGFRCDMTELVPPAFWAWAIPLVRARYPETLFLAEIYQPHRYGEYLRAGFDYLYDKVGVYDFLIALGKGGRDAADFTAVRDAVGADQAAMCYFTENHDEQRLASDFVFASARQGFLATAIAALSGGNPLLLYFGQELGERGMDTEGFSGRDGRTTIFDYWSLDKLQRLEAGHYTTAQLTTEEARLLSDYQRLATYYTDPIISSGAYYGLCPEGEGKAQVLSFVRSTSEGLYLVVANFAPTIAKITLPLSADFFSTLGLSEGRAYRATERLTGAVEFLCLTELAPLHFTLTPHALKVLRLTAV